MNPLHALLAKNLFDQSAARLADRRAADELGQKLDRLTKAQERLTGELARQRETAEAAERKAAMERVMIESRALSERVFARWQEVYTMDQINAGEMHFHVLDQMAASMTPEERERHDALARGMAQQLHRSPLGKEYKLQQQLKTAVAANAKRQNLAKHPPKDAKGHHLIGGHCARCGCSESAIARFGWHCGPRPVSAPPRRGWWAKIFGRR